MNQSYFFLHSGGGNSTKASSGISCSETHYQAEKNILDTNEAYNKDLLKYYLIFLIYLIDLVKVKVWLILWI